MSSKIKCIIVDDEPLAREGIESYVKQIDFLETVGIFDGALSAMTFLKENHVDLIFLDIQMPSINGLDFVQSLQNPPKIIFTTAFANHAIQGFELNAVDYLLKPIQFNRFLTAVNKIEKSFKNLIIDNQDEYFFIKTDKKFVKIKFDEILFIEGLKDYVKIHTTTVRHIALINMKNIQLQIPQNKFIRVHKSYIVAIDNIAAIEGNVIKIGLNEIPIGREHKEGIDDFIKNKLLKRGS